MRVTVKYFAHLRELVGDRDREEVTLPDGATLLDLLEELSKKHGERFKSFVLRSHELSDRVIVLVNGTPVTDLRHVLCDGDTVSLLSAVGGG